MPCAQLLQEDPKQLEQHVMWINNQGSVNDARDLMRYVYDYQAHPSHTVHQRISLMDGWKRKEMGKEWTHADKYAEQLGKVKLATWDAMLKALHTADPSKMDRKLGTSKKGMPPTMDNDIQTGAAYAKYPLDILKPLKGFDHLKKTILAIHNQLHKGFASMDFLGQRRHETKATDLLRGTMLFLGGRNSGTTFHLDWSNATNVAFGIGAGFIVGKTVLAWWLFVRPCETSYRAVSEWLQKNIKGYERINGFIYPNNTAKRGAKSQPPALTEQDLELMRQAPELQGHIKVCKQMHGQMMNAPIGWAHCVVNVRNCIKFALDYVRFEDLPKIAMSHSALNVPFFRQYSAKDYTCAISRAFPHLSSLMLRVREMKLEQPNKKARV